MHPLPSTLAAATAALLLQGAPAPAPPFRLPSARGPGFVALEDFAGRVLYVDVERTGCPRSRAQAPALAALRQEYGERGFEALTVYDEIDGGDPFVRALADARAKSYAHPIAVNDGGEFHEGYYRAMRATPSGFLVSRSGALEPLGADPLGESHLSSTRARIEARLAEPAGASAAPASRPALAPFELRVAGGGAVRSAELAGKPAALVLWEPGPAWNRLAPSVEAWASRTLKRARVLTVCLAGDSLASEAAAACPSAVATSAAPAAAPILGAGRTPHILFLDAQGRVAKRIAVLYGQVGVEEAVGERILWSLLVEAGIDPVEPKKTTVSVRDTERNVAFLVSDAFAEVPEPEGALKEFVARGAAGPAAPRLRSRLVSSRTDAAALAEAKRAAGAGRAGYRVDGEETLKTGAVLMADRWDQDGMAFRGMRLFVNTPKGLLEIAASGSALEWPAVAPDFRSTAQSVVVGR